MDTTQGQDFASLLTDRRDDLEESAERISAIVGRIDSFWRGLDAESFRQEWDGLRSGQISSTLDLFTELFEELRKHCDEQDVASEANGSDDGFDLGDIFRGGDMPGWRDLLPNDWEDVLGLGVAGVLDGLDGAYGALSKYLGDPKMIASLFMVGGDEMADAALAASRSAGALSKVFGAAGAVVSGGFAAWDRWEADAADPSLSTGERAGRAAVDGLANAGGGALGGWGGVAGGAALGTMIFPGVGTVIGGAVGGLVGGLVGGTAGNFLADWALG